MKKIVLSILDEITFLSIEKDLDELGVTYTQRPLSDSSFVSLNELQSFGEIIIKTDNTESIQKLLVNPAYKGRLQVSSSEIKVSERPNYIQRGLIVYSILITVFFAKYWHIDYINSSDKNFNIHWNYSNTRLDYVDKKSKKVVHSFFDANYDLNYELQYEYNQGKGPVSIRYDNDENGYYEKVELFTLNGEYSGVYFDSNQNGLYEFSLTILENGDTLKLRDTNEDGFMKIDER
ncbi:hypothetical protein FNH22_13905 [Fulvivirga sp. M361]|uniref:hypothetical protein n=1 Tax=Fulvivirga sp. M361 TaxID=2594266 RepID=UPI00117B31C8|nr:hypothetical protein [Fulvivirga sp. M361]TRX58435.1 hypothetical protein FNH22_13905 [Fulvivirga sp. M361]